MTFASIVLGTMHTFKTSHIESKMMSTPTILDVFFLIKRLVGVSFPLFHAAIEHIQSVSSDLSQLYKRHFIAEFMVPTIDIMMNGCPTA